jgi:hypothetical protein
MTDLFGDIIKLERSSVMNKDYVIAQILIPKSLGFIGRSNENQIRFEDIHFGRVRLIQDDVVMDV